MASGQVNAIIHLVSSSIPNMTKEDVTVIDQNGKLLSKSLDDPDSMLNDAQLEHRVKLENIYRSFCKYFQVSLYALIVHRLACCLGHLKILREVYHSDQ